MSNEVFKDASQMSGGRESDDAIIVIDGVYKRFKEFEALKNIKMQVGRKEVVVVIGPSGSGKSTLIRCINRLETHDAGHIFVDGTALTTDIRNIQEIRRETGMVFQNFNLFPHLTVLTNVAIGPRRVRGLSKSAAEELAMELLTRVKIPEQADKFPAQLSGGQRQRIAIARALLKDAPILILDEATSALDTESEHHIQQALERLMEGRTTLVIAHRLSTIEKADRILVLDQGQLIEQGSHTELLEKNGLYTQLYKMDFADNGHG